MPFAFSLAAPNAGRSIPARMAMIAITTRSSIRVKILVFTLEVRTEEQGNNRTIEQFNNRKKKEEVRSGDWQRPALLCCRRNETSFLQLFILRKKNIEQGIRKLAGTGKQSNNRILEQFNNRRKKEEARSGDWQFAPGLESATFSSAEPESASNNRKQKEARQGRD